METVKLISLAKIFVGDVTSEIADQCLQFHGGWGYIEEFRIARAWRDQRLFRIGGGTTETHALLRREADGALAGPLSTDLPRGKAAEAQRTQREELPRAEPGRSVARRETGEFTFGASRLVWRPSRLSVLCGSAAFLSPRDA